MSRPGGSEAPASVRPMLRPLLACLLLALVAAPAAEAASTTQILRDCADDGVLQGHYTPSELRAARNNIPTDTDEYTDCRDVLARAAADAIAGSGGGGAGGTAGGGGAPAGGGAAAGVAGGATGADAGPVNTNTPEARAVVAAAAAKGRPAPVEVGGRSVIPGDAGLAAGAVRNTVPRPLLAVLVLLAAAALASAVPVVRRRVLPRFKR